MNYKKIETDIINMLLSYKSNKFDILKKQFLNSKVINREENTSWFFIKIEVNTDIEKIDIKQRLIFWDVISKANWKIFMWFLLYIENWYISLLEWYTFDDDFVWFNNNTYNLEFELPNKRKIPKELLF